MIARKTRPAALTAGFGAAVISAAVAFVGPEEGLRTEPYRDLGGILTVCYGDTIVPMRTYTVAECDDMFAARLREFAFRLGRCIENPSAIPAKSSVAILSWSYNVGTGAACGSTLVRKLNAGDLRGACNELPRWNKVNGKVVRGLTNRRAREQALCLEGVTQPKARPVEQAKPRWMPNWLARLLGWAA